MNLVEDEPCLHQRRKRKGESVKILAPRNLTWVSTRRKRKGEPVKILAPRNLTWITIRRKRKGESVKILAPRRKRKGESVKILAPSFSPIVQELDLGIVELKALLHERGCR
ncbi:uncharacterized protein LOC122092081 [Macadamia integrifolia]|uniref:uncharacterized protein LOC122092081 n=1 Tax=Macadamia integrifolia TaxID=60698 RepID=UPI001C4F99DC|nr:uncharacterized protein LOC122092081 [Macadamia integrifolia]